MNGYFHGVIHLVSGVGGGGCVRTNLQLLSIETYKALNNLSSPLMSDLFSVKDARYNLRKGKH